MTQLRLYPITIGPKPDICDGCGALLEPHTKAVLRQDGGKFCAHTCATEHDDAPVQRVPSESAP